jgi:hypothetical protein
MNALRFDEAVSGQGRVSDPHRQAGADFMHLRRNSGPETAITAAAIDRPNLDH